MKILFVDNSADLQDNWVYPLRKKGWGVVRARSAEDATRMMVLHSDGLEAIAVNEKFVPWAEKQGLPFVVLVMQWTQHEITKHQNSDHSAVAYLPFDRGCEEIYSMFEPKDETRILERPSPQSSGSSALKLEEYTHVLAKPETTRMVSGLQLVQSEVVLGGNPALPEVQAVSMDSLPDDGFEEGSDDRTVMLESTQLNVASPELPSLDDLIELSDQIEVSLETAPSPAPSFSKPPPPPSSPRYSAPQVAPAMPVNNQFAIDPTPSNSVSDAATLKSYLALREQDVAVLGGQVRSSQERIQQLESLLKVEKARGAELSHVIARQEKQIKNYDQEKQVEFEVLEKHIEDVDAQLKDRTDKVRTIEAKLRITVEEVNKVKERVRVDIRRIRVREKELESQLEVLKKDSSALLQARDEKIIELKRKLDLLEFNMELVQEQYSKERRTADELKTRLKDAASVMKQAGGLLEQ